MTSSTTEWGSRTAHLRERLPEHLDELTGPITGTVELPVHLAWSGLRAFDLDEPKLLLGMYRIVIGSGLHEDITTYLSAGLLRQHWPVLRRMLSKAVRAVWEEHFPELRPAAAA
ncbi:hypothetical protein [Streptomyces sp. NPDC048639]|uniref:hypothetical protein n=1 Tax=Streptomyces sp. NPDC048639 TaxID=3365581 RepID=UPI00371D8797